MIKIKIVIFLIFPWIYQYKILELVHPLAMGRLTLLFLSFFVGPPVAAPRDQDDSSKIEHLNMDSLEIRTSFDSLTRSVSARKPKVKDLKDNLNDSLDLPNTTLNHTPANEIEQKTEKPQQKVHAVAYSLKTEAASDAPG